VNQSNYDDIVVGAGVLGLAHAYHLARRGLRVAVLDRSLRATGASVRNFGMLWPIGQPLGDPRALAVRSLEIWLEVLRCAGVPHDCCGSLHLAYHEDEAQVLREYAALSEAAGETAELLEADEITKKTGAVRREGLQAALWSARETCIDPRAALARIPIWLHEEFAVQFHFGTAVRAIDSGVVHSGARSWKSQRVWICSGHDFETLFPEQLAACGMVRCKLQMLRSHPQSGGWKLGPMLAAGLTLRHYRAFEPCPTLPALKARVAKESPWFDRHGVHVMVSQNADGELTIGDSHEYDDPADPFDKVEIDALILGYLETFLDVPELRIAARWHGVYAKHPEQLAVILNPQPFVTVVTGVGGAGMTLSFGIAEQVVQRALQEDKL
jgi:FAD dependent oxidoreductase TIGR03364